MMTCGCDMFSYGLTALYVCTGKHPYDNIKAAHKNKMCPETFTCRETFTKLLDGMSTEFILGRHPPAVKDQLYLSLYCYVVLTCSTTCILDVSEICKPYVTYISNHFRAEREFTHRNSGNEFAKDAAKYSLLTGTDPYSVQIREHKAFKDPEYSCDFFMAMLHPDPALRILPEEFAYGLDVKILEAD